MPQENLQIVQRLDVCVYEADGSYHEEFVRNPSWSDVDAAIRRLDKHAYPFLFLQLRADPQDDPGERFEIMGGHGDYWIAGSFGRYSQRRYTNPSGGTHEVTVWTGDQGFGDRDCYICHDQRKGLQAARYFFDRGDFDPSLTWEDQST